MRRKASWKWWTSENDQLFILRFLDWSNYTNTFRKPSYLLMRNLTNVLPKSRSLMNLYTMFLLLGDESRDLYISRALSPAMGPHLYEKKQKKIRWNPSMLGQVSGSKKYILVYTYILYIIIYIYITSIYIYSRGPFSGAFADQISYYETSWTWWDGPGTWQLGIDKDIYEYWGIAWCIVYLRVSKQMSLHLICLI